MLTQAQFARTAVGKHPKASYENYVKYVTRTRASRAAASASDPMGGFQGQLAGAPAAARSDVNTQVNAALAGYRATTRAAQQQAIRQATRAQGFAKALAQLTSTSPGETRDIYQGAANRMRAYGTGLTGAVAQAQQQQSAQAAQEVAGATGGLGRLVGYDPNALRNVSQYTGVVIPGTSLEEQAANAMVAAQGQRAADVGQIGQIAQQYRAKTTDLQSELAAKRAALEATRPDLYRQALTARQQEARAQEAADLQRRQTIASLTGVDPYTGRPTADMQLAGIKRADELTQAQIKRADDLAQARVENAFSRARIGVSRRQANIAAKREAAYERTQRGLPGGLKQSDIRQYGHSAVNVASRAFFGKANPNYLKGAITDPNDPNFNPKALRRYAGRPQTASQALKTMRAAQIPYSIAMNAIAQFAQSPDSWWNREFKAWFPHGYPPPAGIEPGKPGPGAR